jgi:hypothetical protein
MQAGKSWLENLRERFETFLSGRAPTDPLYLTNRTWKQKLKLAGLIALPVLVLAVLIGIGSTDPFHLNKADPYEHPLKEVAPKVASKPLPDPKLAPKDLDVINIRILTDVSPPVVTGIVRNNTGQDVESAEVSYYLADHNNSVIGTESTSVQNVRAHDSVTFRTSLKTVDAQYVLVRDVRTN